MNQYKLIAFDMDGTLLNSEKKISPETLASIHHAFAVGKEVVLSTGRCLPELQEYLSLIPELRYIVCTSGALVYDMKEKQAIYSNALAEETVKQIIEISRMEDVMLHFLTTESIVERDKVSHMQNYEMGIYQPMFQKTTRKVDDIAAYFLSHPSPIEKINIYHTDPEARSRTMNRLKKYPLELIFAESSSLECSSIGATKGNGLQKLCDHLHISMAEVIAVGDADNDLDVLGRAGLSIAMENANPNVRRLCKVTVADNDHNGCKEAIDHYLLRQQ